MGIWQHIHTVTTTTTDISPDLGEFSEIIDDVSVEMIPIRYCWGCRTFQTASQIHVIHILGVWTPYTVVDGHIMAAHSYRYHHRRIPRFGRVYWNHRMYMWKLSHYAINEAVETFKLHPLPYHTHIMCFNTLHSCGWTYGSTFIPLPPQTYPQIWESWLKS